MPGLEAFGLAHALIRDAAYGRLPRRRGRGPPRGRRMARTRDRRPRRGVGPSGSRVTTRRLPNGGASTAIRTRRRWRCSATPGWPATATPGRVAKDSSRRSGSGVPSSRLAPATPRAYPAAMPTCSICGASNPEGSRFCNACGAKLAEAADERSGERRVVTMLFCDVRGSTAMAETLDAEAWTDVMNSAYELLIEPVVRHEGTVARLMGDAILAFFGAPTAHEDDPQRAVMAGLEIVSAIAPFKERLKAERGLDLDVRVGINTGPVVVGEVGSDLRSRVHGDGRRGERRRPDGADGRARNGPDHRGHVPARRGPVRGRGPRAHRGEGQARALVCVPRPRAARGAVAGARGTDARDPARRPRARARARALGARAHRSRGRHRGAPRR